MADILSQSEIDELLVALASGRAEPQEPQPVEELQQVRVYDFRTANKFSKEQMRMLNFIYESYAGRLGTFLSGSLRARCDVELVSIEEQTFSEFSNSLPSPAFIAILNMPPLAGSALLEVSTTIGYEIISRLLGGTGTFSDLSSKSFTEIELSILTRICGQMLSIMNESWSRVTPIRSMIERVETSAQFAQIVVSSEPIAIITISVTIGDVSDIINFCIPHPALQPIANKMTSKLWYNDQRTGQTDQEMMKDPGVGARIASTPVTLRAMFEPTHATVGDILNLQVGDVIRVEHPLSQGITVLVEHIPKFKAKIGHKGQQIAVKITEIIKEVADDE